MDSSLNEKQKEFVTSDSGPLIAIAGPGTGKTHCLIEKIRFNKGKKILTLTFTNKAASEIKDRLGRQNGVSVHTFHSFCLEMLKYQMDFNTAPEYQRLLIASKLKNKYSLSKNPKKILFEISRFKNSDVTNKLIADYDQQLHSNNYLDYDDLISKTIKLEKVFIPVYDLVLVDEFQDTNSKQLVLLNHIVSNDNIAVIDDPNQSIYSFRGASAHFFNTFKKQFPKYKQIIFDINYRSTKKLIFIANNIFPRYKLKSASNNKGEVSLVKTPTRLSEAKFIFNCINEKVGGVDILKASDYANSRADCHFKDFAIIYRKHADCKYIRKVLDEEGIPLQQIGEESPFNSLKAQKMLSFMQKNSVDYLNASSSLNYEVPEIAELSERFSNKSVAEFLNYIEKISDLGYWDYLGDKVTLCTIHAAKGLEFEYVFIPQFVSNNYPQKNADEDEEKRLFYVAVTRAKQGLYLLNSSSKSRYDKYLEDQAGHVRDEQGYKSLDRAKIKKLKRSQLDLF